SRRTAMICSCVNRFLFISPSFDQGPGSNRSWMTVQWHVWTAPAWQVLFGVSDDWSGAGMYTAFDCGAFMPLALM
ncbi:hypothetical protein, partial [Mesorhizobium sp. B2-5-9]|uniref:hypothetical protein n=1 Tax=Mesorhizobium sp. B2-5-9 TaxID=2589921 RepID=UPI001AED6FAF